ncbi:MAG: Gfo/Idh/MocA family protein [Verrucomicrobiota bacterium]
MSTAVVVGAGGISNAWFPPLKAENVDILSLVDLDIGRAEAAKEKHGLDCPVSDDLKTVLAKQKPDFVVDLTIPAAHCEVTCTALEAGCHVVGEKPMAGSMNEARRMVRAAEDAGRMYMVGQSRRWATLPATVAATVATGQIGEITAIDCQFYLGMHFGGFREEMDSPLILDMGVHHFDLARFFTGCTPSSVFAREYNPKGSWYKGDVAASCIFEMANGAVFTYSGSWCSTGKDTSWHGNWRIIGDRGSLIFENDQPPVGEKVGKAPVTRGPTNADVVPVEIPPVELQKQGQHGALHEMLRFLETGETPQTECHDNIQSMAMVFGAIESSKTGGRIPIQTA